MLISMKEMLAPTREHRFAIGAFNVADSCFIRAVVEEAKATNTPAIISIHPSELEFVTDEFFGYVHERTLKSSVPFTIHLDHGASIAEVLRAIRCGFTSVMIDGSLLPYEENVADEVQKYLDSDVVIYQMPGWWMGKPWTVKKYIDKVFTQGHGALYASDASKKYGSGGLIQGKKYMLSLTWNAPLEAFTDPDQFFEGIGVDSLYLHFHKANQFLDMESLPTFICNDVIKQPDVPRDIARYRTHLSQIFA